MEEARNGEGGNSSFAKEKSSRGEFERPQITGRGWKEGFAGRWKRVAGEQRRRGRERKASSGNVAITGVVEGEEYRWRHEAAWVGGEQGEGVWQAADAGRDMLYDVCSSHRPSLIN